MEKQDDISNINVPCPEALTNPYIQNYSEEYTFPISENSFKPPFLYYQNESQCTNILENHNTEPENANNNRSRNSSSNINQHEGCCSTGGECICVFCKIIWSILIVLGILALIFFTF